MKDGSSGVGIRLGRLRKTGLDGKGGSSSGSASSGGSNSSYHETDLEKLRKSIQLLVQHTGILYVNILHLLIVNTSKDRKEIGYDICMYECMNV